MRILMILLIISFVFIACNKTKKEIDTSSVQGKPYTKRVTATLSDCELFGSIDGDDSIGKISVYIVNTETGDAEGEGDVICMLYTLGKNNKTYRFLFNYPSSGIELEKDSICAEVSYKAEFIDNGDEGREKLLWATGVKYLER